MSKLFLKTGKTVTFVIKSSTLFIHASGAYQLAMRVTSGFDTPRFRIESWELTVSTANMQPDELQNLLHFQGIVLYKGSLLSGHLCPTLYKLCEWIFDERRTWKLVGTFEVVWAAGMRSLTFVSENTQLWGLLCLHRTGFFPTRRNLCVVHSNVRSADSCLLARWHARAAWPFTAKVLVYVRLSLKSWQDTDSTLGVSLFPSYRLQNNWTWHKIGVRTTTIWPVKLLGGVTAQRHTSVALVRKC